MADHTDLSALNRRLTVVRMRLVNDYPFFGRLLLRLPFGFASCGTAFTDTRRIVFDPAFAERLTDGELAFVMLHEVMHCVLNHCTRGRTLLHMLYNIACDIAVNSFILETLNVSSFTVDGEEVMHLAPDGREGRLLSSEEIYEQLLRRAKDDGAGGGVGVGKNKKSNGADHGTDGKDRDNDRGGRIDTHDVWQEIDAQVAEDVWKQAIREEAARGVADGTGIPSALLRQLAEISHAPRTNWRQLLQDFIRHDRDDFVWTVPDRRFQGDFILPSFRENVYGDSVDRLWFLIDVSGSISSRELSELFFEVRQAVEQIDSLSGDLSFFHTDVTEPRSFDSVESLERIRPVGCGGTSFHAIFQALPKYYKKDLPRAIIVLTDGWADFPDEKAALGVPVFWIVVNSQVTPPWGEHVFIVSDD